jgi:hypothetical protein
MVRVGGNLAVAALLGTVACALGEASLHQRLPATVRAPRKEALEAVLGGRDASKRYLRSRLVGWPAQPLVDGRSLPQDDRLFLRRVARDTWRGLEALSDRENALPLDHVRFGDSLDPADATIGDYVSTADIGLFLVAVVAARELGLVSATEASKKLGAVLDSLDRVETWHGFSFNFYDTTTLERTSDFVSFVDSSWLAAGLMVVRSSFPALAARCSAALASRDFGRFYDPKRKLMSHGEYVDPPQRSPFHYGVFYTEARLGSLIAIGKGDVPREHWFAMTRTPPPPGWGASSAGQLELARAHLWPSAYYQWKGLRYVPSWGGSMFEALMPTLLLDERSYAPASLGRNDEVHAVVQRRYALEELGLPVWGMSPSWQPGGERYSEHGVAPLGFQGYGGRAVTPHAAALALGATPREAIADLRQLAERYDVYGEYGFYDAVDPATGTVARVYLSLDQAMILIALANHLEGGVIQRRFVADPIAQAALPLLRDEDSFEGAATATRVRGPAPPKL